MWEEYCVFCDYDLNVEMYMIEEMVVGVLIICVIFFLFCFFFWVFGVCEGCVFVFNGVNRIEIYFGNCFVVWNVFVFIVLVED